MGRMADCECGGFILAYLVTGSSGICMPHFGSDVMSLTMPSYETFKNKSIKKERVRPRNKVNDLTLPTEPHPDARKGTEYTGIAWSQQKSKIIAVDKESYRSYLRTPYWKEVSRLVKKRYGWRCGVCNSPLTLQAHHRTYEHQGDELNHLDDLICLCKVCHKLFHSEQRKKTRKRKARLPKKPR
jgi:hypothetical protein